MNADLEEVDAVVIPELLTEEQAAAITDPKVFEQQLQAIERLALQLKPVDPLSMKQCAALVVTATFAARFAEAQRVAIVEPHNKVVKEANAIWQPIVLGLKAKLKEVGASLSAAIEAQRRLAQQAQQKAIDDAKRAQDEQDRKERAAREEADRLRAVAEVATSAEEQAKLLKQADRLEAKADQSALVSVPVLVVQQQAKTLDVGSATFSARAPKKTWILAGWDKAKPLRLTDPTLAGLLGDLSSLTPAARFLLVHADLNPVYLNKSFGVVEFPAPFASVDDFGGSAVRGK